MSHARHLTRRQFLKAAGAAVAAPPSLAQVRLGANDLRLYVSRNHPGNFLDCIRTRRRCVADAETACRSISVCHLGNIAYWLDRRLKWDPIKEEFAGDDEADRFLDRPKREPWRI
jgi:hypothetical protein